jgi:uncharacterized protein YneF (UPF0154 family)
MYKGKDMEEIVTIILSFIGGWIIGYLIAFIKKKKKKNELPLLTPEEKEIYKMLKESFEEVKQEIRRIEEKLG